MLTITHSMFFFSPSLSETTPRIGWKEIAESDMQEKTMPVWVLLRPISSESQIGRNGKQVAMMKKYRKTNRPKIQNVGLFLWVQGVVFIIIILRVEAAVRPR
jgi:hypothetical protein